MVAHELSTDSRDVQSAVLVEGGVDDVTVDPHHVLEVSTSGVQALPDVREYLAVLRLQIELAKLAGRALAYDVAVLVGRDLAGDEDERLAGDFDDVRVGAARLGDLRRNDVFEHQVPSSGWSVLPPPGRQR